jgi:serine/threonine protein kinase
VSQQDGDTRPGEQQAPPEVPDFDLIRPVGRGGFGEVWLATNRTTGQLRAVKIIPLPQAGEADPAAREITSLTRLEAAWPVSIATC